MTVRLRSLQDAAAFVDRVGVALVFGKPDVALPSLFEAVAGPGPTPWAAEREDGKLTMTPALSLVWTWKDALAEQRLACAGLHVKGRLALVSLALLPALYALTGRSGTAADFRDAVLPPLEREIAEAVLETAPADSRDIRRAVGVRDTARVNRAIDSLQRQLVLTRAGTVERAAGWAGCAFDVLPRRYRLASLPAPEEARGELAAALVRTAGDLSAADVSRALGFSRAEAAAALERASAGVSGGGGKATSPGARPGSHASVNGTVS